MTSTAMAATLHQHQWSEEETREFIRIRADLEKDLTAVSTGEAPAAKKKTLWEMASVRMREKGFWRTADQCKCKWKNLLSRYKGKETSHKEYGWQCPFFEEIHAVFTERGKAMHRLLLEPEACSISTKKRGRERSLEEHSDLKELNEDETEEEVTLTQRNSQKRKAARKLPAKSLGATDSKSSSSSISYEIQEMLKGFLQWQQRMEMEWREIVERHYNNRRMLEQEWRESMEKLERERLMAEQAWREREEQRKEKQDIRAEGMNALLTTLLNKLNHENNL
ncbi:trihelix transcription factor GT-3b-like [Cucumis melo var. makuwa]|nr:trihelix transcription factor GT-3b-like [Cucumis melo var. makuwa]TYK16505.1 trihelix transcription factor GT-3b-like [Cucumis melo var. makuwa]